MMEHPLTGWPTVCSWAEPGLCTACVELSEDLERGAFEQPADDEPLVTLATDAECMALLRERRRAGA
jgi:hypothetical protein